MLKMFISKVFTTLLAAGFGVTAPIEKAPKTYSLSFDIFKKSRNTGASKATSPYGVNATLINEYNFYVATVNLGTPAQTLKVLLDTGSSDLWVPGEGAESLYGTFNASESSTFKNVSSDFHILYNDGTSARGVWASDTFSIGDAEVDGLQFGYATYEDSGEGVLGIGLRENEASNARNNQNRTTYDNLPLLLKSQGIIDSISYSLFLDSPDATSGTLTFGGIDKTKYEGDLHYFDLLDVDLSGQQTDSPSTFSIDLDGIATGNMSFQQTYPALLDSGSTLVYAPKAIANKIGERYGTYDQSSGLYKINCNATGDDFVYTFGNLTITIPFSSAVYETNGALCALGIFPNQQDTYILGDGLLRSAYAHYDLEGLKIGLAQAKY